MAEIGGSDIRTARRLCPRPSILPICGSELCVCVFLEERFAALRYLVPGAWLLEPDGSCRWVRALEVHRAISTGQLRGLPRFHLRPIDVVVFHGSRRDLVLRRVSRLDAFSGYPVRT